MLNLPEYWSEYRFNSSWELYVAYCFNRNSCWGYLTLLIINTAFLLLSNWISIFPVFLDLNRLVISILCSMALFYWSHPCSFFLLSFSYNSEIFMQLLLFTSPYNMRWFFPFKVGNLDFKRELLFGMKIGISLKMKVCNPWTGMLLLFFSCVCFLFWIMYAFIF